MSSEDLDSMDDGYDVDEEEEEWTDMCKCGHKLQSHHDITRVGYMCLWHGCHCPAFRPIKENSNP